MQKTIGLLKFIILCYNFNTNSILDSKNCGPISPNAEILILVLTKTYLALNSEKNRRVIVALRFAMKFHQMVRNAYTYILGLTRPYSQQFHNNQPCIGPSIP